MFIAIDILVLTNDQGFNDQELINLIQREVEYSQCIVSVRDIVCVYKDVDKNDSIILLNNGHSLQAKQEVNEIIEKINKSLLLQKVQ